MAIRTSFRVAGDRALSAERLFGDDVGPIADGGSFGRGDLLQDEDGGAPGAEARDAPPITEILRGVDLDALLHGMTGGEFLYGGWADELPSRHMGRDLLREIDLLFPGDEADTPLVLPPVPDGSFLTKDADMAQVLPGVTSDEFLLSKDVDLPLVLPGDDDGFIGVLDQGDNPEGPSGSPNHMLTLDPDGGFVVGTDDFGRLHDHDGWLF